VTRDEARQAAAMIMARCGPCHVARLRHLQAGPQRYITVDSELGAQFRIDGSVHRRALVHSYGGGLSPVMSALTPLGRTCLELTGGAS